VLDRTPRTGSVHDAVHANLQLVSNQTYRKGDVSDRICEIDSRWQAGLDLWAGHGNILFVDLTRVPLCLGPMLETCSKRFTRRGCPGAAARTITLAIKCGVVRLLCRRLYPQCRSAPFTSLLTQGSHLMVQGAVRSREYQRDGVKHRVFELRAGTKAISSLTRARADASSGAGLKQTDPARFTGTRSCWLMSYRHQPRLASFISALLIASCL
jgi:hypothetical protein